MNFKNISIIIAFLYLNSKVLSSPIKSKRQLDSNLSTNDVENPLDINEVSISDIDVEVSDVETDFAYGEEDSGSETETEIPSIIEDPETNTEECLTPECVEASKRILSKMDLTADPCEDFYQFTCGTWMNEKEIPKNEFRIGSFKEAMDDSQVILHQILEGDYPVDTNLSEEDQKLDKEIFNKVKTIYDTCMDEDAINKNGKESLINLLNKLDIYNSKSKYDSVDGLSNILVDLHHRGVNTLFNLITSIDIVNHDIYGMGIEQPNLTLLKDHYKDENILSQYKEIIIDTLNRLFDENQQKERNIEEMANKIIEFEKKLADSLIPSEQLQNVLDLYKPTTLGKLMETHPNINWKLYFSKRFKNYDMKTPVNDDTFIVNLAESYFSALNKLLGETDVDSLIYYAEWSVITYYMSKVNDDFSQPFNDFVNLLTYGMTEKKERSNICIEVVEKTMGTALGKYYIEKAFEGRSKEISKEIINNIKQAMLERIPKMAWIDKATAEYAIEKVNKMSSEKIGYADYILKPEELWEKDYKGFEFDSESLFNTIINSEMFLARKAIKKLDVPVDDSEWRMTPQTVNAYYYPMDNSINFPAAIFQLPFFSTDQPDYLNYGAIGSIAGHELTHAFDSSGSLFDANGVLNNWWTNSTYYEFDNLSKCFIDQYNQYKLIGSEGKEFNLNGKLTLNENLADNGGLSRSFEAWKLSSIKDPKKFSERNKALPGLSDFTPEQLFYIAFGQSFCEKNTPELLEMLNETDPHSPGQYRIIGSVSNNEHFAKTFNCPKNSPMNPEKKCLIW